MFGPQTVTCTRADWSALALTIHAIDDAPSAVRRRRYKSKSARARLEPRLADLADRIRADPQILAPLAEHPAWLLPGDADVWFAITTPSLPKDTPGNRACPAVVSAIR